MQITKRLAGQKEVCDDAHGPNIDGLSVTSYEGYGLKIRSITRDYIAHFF